MQSWTPTAGTPQGAVISPLLANLYLHPLDVKMSELGYRFEAGRRWVRHKSLKGFKDKVRENTKRTRGESMRTTIDELTPMIRGWFGYFKHAHPHTFTNLDGLIRRRLRSILRKQEKRPAQQAKPALFVLGYRDDMLASDPGFGVVCSAVCWGSSSCPLRWVSLGGWRAIETKSLSQAGRISQVVSTSSPLPPSRS